MNTATTSDCPICGLTFITRETDPAAAVVAIADALEQHLNDHHQHNPEGDQA